MSLRPEPRRYRFGVFEVDVRAGEVRQRGLRVRMHRQPFEVLRLLLERPGEVVTREEIAQVLWAEGTFVDFDHGVNAAVNRLREALRDRANEPRYIETLPRRGYRFVGPVEVVGEEPLGERPQRGAGGTAAGEREGGLGQGQTQIACGDDKGKGGRPQGVVGETAEGEREGGFGQGQTQIPCGDDKPTGGQTRIPCGDDKPSGGSEDEGVAGGQVGTQVPFGDDRQEGVRREAVVQSGTWLTTPEALPRLPGQGARLLFLLLQGMYLVFYVGALANLSEVQGLLEGLPAGQSAFLAAAALAACCIPLRLYLLGLAGLQPPRARERFLRVWPLVLGVDLVGALSPLLLVDHISFGLALACVCPLVYAPFAERSLVLMGAVEGTEHGAARGPE